MTMDSVIKVSTAITIAVLGIATGVAMTVSCIGASRARKARQAKKACYTEEETGPFFTDVPEIKAKKAGFDPKEDKMQPAQAQPA